MAATGSDMTSAKNNSAESNAKPAFHVVLFQPEIPQNTGNIGRSCVALGAKLWMVRPIGFRLDSSQLKRSGMDYWQDLDWQCVDNWQQLESELPNARVWLLTKFGQTSYTDVQFSRGDVLVFGNESSGLPDSIHKQYSQRRLTIPMPGPVRCLNLATSAGIVMYEAARQTGLLHFSSTSVSGSQSGSEPGSLGDLGTAGQSGSEL